MRRRDVGGFRIALGLLGVTVGFFMIINVIISPAVQNPSQPMCDNQPMRPGDVCSIMSGSSLTYVTYDQMLQDDQQAAQAAPIRVLLGAALLIAGIAFIVWGVAARRREKDAPPYSFPGRF